MNATSFDPAKMRSLLTVSHTSGLFSGIFDPTSQRFIGGCIDGSLVAWNYPALDSPTPFGWRHRSYVYALAALPQHREIVSAGLDRRLVWWDPVAATPLREVMTSARPLNLAVSPDEQRLAVVDDDRWLHLYDTLTGKLLASYDGHPMMTAKLKLSSIYSVAFSPDSQLVATGDRTGTVLVREVATGKIIHTLDAKQFYNDYAIDAEGKPNGGEHELGGARLLIFSPDGKTLVVGGMADYEYNSAATDGRMGFIGFELEKGEAIFKTVLPKDKGYLQTAVFHPNGLLLAAGGGGTAGASGVGTLCVLDLAKSDQPTAYPLEATIRAIALSATHDQVILFGMLKTAVAGHVETWELPAPADST
ncbi:MAG: hypothetical protein O3C60_02975 [Planctomycetota bacterium]|nr:hypothetical protein [Planctomycetota bacterium]